MRQPIDRYHQYPIISNQFIAKTSCKIKDKAKVKDKAAAQSLTPRNGPIRKSDMVKLMGLKKITIILSFRVAQRTIRSSHIIIMINF